MVNFASLSHPSQRDLALVGIYLVVVIDMMSSALTVPVMPFYVHALCDCPSPPASLSSHAPQPERCVDPVCNSLGGASGSLGFLFSVFAVAQFLSNGWMGPLSDAVGRRAILTVTLGGAGVGMIGSSLAPSFVWLVASRVFIGEASPAPGREGVRAPRAAKGWGDRDAMMPSSRFLPPSLLPSSP